MTLLQLVQQFCLRTGISAPEFVVSSTDNQIQQILGLLNEVLDNLTNRKTTTFAKREVTFVTLAQENQGAITTIAPDGFMHQIVANTLYNRTSGEEITGPVESDKWQALKAGSVSLMGPVFRFLGGDFYIYPAPTAGQTVAFEHKSSFVVIAADTTKKQYFTADDDTCFYPDALLIAGLRWIWKREKGLRYGEEFRNFEFQVANLLGSEGGNKTISLDNTAPAGAPFGVVGG